MGQSTYKNRNGVRENRSTSVGEGAVIPLCNVAMMLEYEEVLKRASSLAATGMTAAAFPEAWIGLFGHDPAMMATGVAYLRAVGPVYGFFGLGLSLYFASQGAGRLLWLFGAGLLRMTIAVVGGWATFRLTGSLRATFVVLGLALVVYGTMLATAIRAGVWLRGR